MKHKIYFTLPLVCLLLSGCQSDPNKILKEKYPIYYELLGAMKGLEVYAWKNETEWYSALLGGTNRFKSVDEVKSYQDKYPCPIDDMRTILDYYHKNDSEHFYVSVDIVSNPPTEEELTHNTDTQSAEYIYVVTKLGLADNY